MKMGFYRPIKESELYSQHNFFLPHEPENVNVSAKDKLERTDLLVAEVSYPSTGQGIELGLASAKGIRIVCLYISGAKPPSSLHFVTSDVIEYSSVNDLLAKLKVQLG